MSFQTTEGSSILLTSERISLRSVEQSDYRQLYNYMYGEPNPEWKCWDAPYYPLEPISFEKFSQQLNQRLNKGEVPSAMLIEVGQQMIGSVIYYWEHADSYWLEVGIVIYVPKYWGQGYGTEALKLWIDYLFDQMPLIRIGLSTWSGNERMIHCAEKLGMTLEGRIRQSRLVDGHFYDSIKMGMLREEWEQQHASR